MSALLGLGFLGAALYLKRSGSRTLGATAWWHPWEKSDREAWKERARKYPCEAPWGEPDNCIDLWKEYNGEGYADIRERWSKAVTRLNDKERLWDEMITNPSGFDACVLARDLFQKMRDAYKEVRKIQSDPRFNEMKKYLDKYGAGEQRDENLGREYHLLERFKEYVDGAHASAGNAQKYWDQYGCADIAGRWTEGTSLFGLRRLRKR